MGKVTIRWVGYDHVSKEIGKEHTGGDERGDEVIREEVIREERRSYFAPDDRVDRLF